MNLKSGYAFLVVGLLVGCGADPEPVEDDAPAPVEEELQPEVIGETAKPGMVMFRVKKAPLRKEVLPKFEQQAGVKITWTGSERLVTIRMIQPMEWREALELVCQFTRTHVTTDYQGRLLLKNGYGGPLTSDGVLLAVEARRQKAGRYSGGATASRSGGSSSSGPAKAYRATWEDSYGTGGSTNTKPKYSKGRSPASLLGGVGGVTHH